MQIPSLETVIQLAEVLIIWGFQIALWGIGMMGLGLAFKMLVGIGFFDLIKKLMIE